MEKYRIYKNEQEIDVYGYDYSFDEEDIKNLWDEHKIFYQHGGVAVLWIEDREGHNPLIHLMEYDDGHIYWRKESDKTFDTYWLDNYISVFTKIKEVLKK